MLRDFDGPEAGSSAYGEGRTGAVRGLCTLTTHRGVEEQVRMAGAITHGSCRTKNIRLRILSRRVGKYANERTRGFASKKEARRYVELSLQEKAKHIEDLRCQVPYDIIINGIKVCRYVADFTYIIPETRERIVEDAKGYRTPIYRLKAKLMRAVHGVAIKEV